MQVRTGPDTFFRRVGTNAMLRTAVQPGITWAIKQASLLVNIPALRDFCACSHSWSVVSCFPVVEACEEHSRGQECCQLFEHGQELERSLQAVQSLHDMAGVSLMLLMPREPWTKRIGHQIQRCHKGFAVATTGQSYSLQLSAKGSQLQTYMEASTAEQITAW